MIPWGNYNIQSVTFYLISSIAITTIAIIGNSTVFIILVKTQFRKEPLFRYLIISTVFDTLNALLIWLTPTEMFFWINEQNLNWILFYKRLNYFIHIGDECFNFS